VTYNYDPLFRLISEQRVGSYAYTVSYEYDGSGNRLAKVWDRQRTDYVYDNADRLQFYGRHDGSVVVYDWDANGNTIARAEGNQTTQNNALLIGPSEIYLFHFNLPQANFSSGKTCC